jgi:saccharopine dehydrogenase (NAD+, L-lysine-forming)
MTNAAHPAEPGARALRVALLGAGGTIAPAIVRDLAESEEAEELLLLDLSAERARAVGEAHGAGKASVRQIDARSGLAGALEGCDLLVNSASYRINLDAMDACLEAGCHYLDLGGLYWMTGRQLERHAEFERAGLLALLGMGSSPGKTNVMGVRALRALGAPAQRVDTIAGGRDLSPPEGFSVPYSLQTILDELTLPPVAVREGRALELESLSDGGRVDFPEPIGQAETIHTLHSEVRTFPESFGCSESSFRLSLSPALLEKLRELRGASDEEIERLARSSPRASGNTVSVHMVEAEAEDGRTVRVTATTTPMEEWGLGGSMVSTAAPAAAAVRLMARGTLSATGALPPERCVEPDDLFPELERRNCTFQVEEAVAQ